MGKGKQRASAGKTVFLFLMLVIYVFPFLLVLINAFKRKTDIIKNPLALIGEKGFTVENFSSAIEKMDFFRALGNSFMITGISVVLILLFSAMAAYIITRTQWRAGNLLFGMMVLSMAVPFQVLMIPLVSIYGGTLGVLNHRGTLIFMHIGFSVSMGVFLFRGTIQSTIPIELEEAAQIDGCGRTAIFFRVVFPLLKPAAATLVIIDVLNLWNDYLLPSLVLGKEELYTLPVATRVFYGAFSSDLGLLMAALVLMILPVLILYLALQKYIIAGVVAGAVKS